MTLKQIIYAAPLTASIVCAGFVYAQPADVQEACSPELRNVMFIILIVWLGIGLYLFQIDRKISKLEKEISDNEK
jgi:CcmD family protein